MQNPVSVIDSIQKFTSFALILLDSGDYFTRVLSWLCPVNQEGFNYYIDDHGLGRWDMHCCQRHPLPSSVDSQSNANAWPVVYLYLYMYNTYIRLITIPPTARKLQQINELSFSLLGFLTPTVHDFLRGSVAWSGLAGSVSRRRYRPTISAGAAANLLKRTPNENDGDLGESMNFQTRP